MSGSPREILQGGTTLFWGPRDRLRLWNWPTLNICYCYIMKWWPSWLQCKCKWWSTTRIQKSKWMLHNYFF